MTKSSMNTSKLLSLVLQSASHATQHVFQWCLLLGLSGILDYNSRLFFAANIDLLVEHVLLSVH